MAAQITEYIKPKKQSIVNFISKIYNSDNLQLYNTFNENIKDNLQYLYQCIVNSEIAMKNIDNIAKFIPINNRKYLDDILFYEQ